MAIDTVLILAVSGVLWILLMTFELAIINQNIHDYDNLMRKLEEIEKIDKETQNYVKYLYEVANGSCKSTDFQSYYPVDWSDAWERLAQQTEDQTLGETGD